jgi:hypothetical protein
MSNSLLLGSIELLDYGDVQLMMGNDYGNPEIETASVARMLYDGDVVTGERAGNRTVRLPLRIVGDNSIARALIVQQIAQTVNRPFQLTWTPDGGLAVVFDCYRAQPVLDYSGEDSEQGHQFLTITCQAEPWTRSPNPITVAPAATAPITLDTFDSAAGITVAAAGSGAGAAAGSAVASPKVQGTNALKIAWTFAAGNNGGYYYQASKTIAAVDVSAAATVGVYVKSPRPNDEVIYADLTLTSAGGASKTWRIRALKFSSGYTLISWDLSDTPYASSGALNLAAITGYVVKISQLNNAIFAAPTSAVAYMDSLAGALAGSSSNLTGGAGWIVFTGVGGAARTPVSLAIDAASAVRRILLSRSPNPRAGFTPVLAVPSSSGAATGDATAISGNRYTTPTYQVPIQSVAGTYAVVVRAKCTAASGTIVATTKVTGDANYSASVTAQIAGASTTQYALYTIGELTLPPREADPQNTAATVDIAISGTAIGSSIDEVYLIDMEGESILIDLPFGASYRYWWIDAPVPGEFQSRIYAGSAADRSDAVAVTPWVKGPAAFNFEPGNNMLTVVADKSTGAPAVTATYYERNLYERAA